MNDPKQGVLIDAVEKDTTKTNVTKSFLITIAAIVLGIYLVNPTMGVFEFLPDNLPIVGNLDEVAATTALLACLSYLGIELPWFRKR